MKTSIITKQISYCLENILIHYLAYKMLLWKNDLAFFQSKDRRRQEGSIPCLILKNRETGSFLYFTIFLFPKLLCSATTKKSLVKSAINFTKKKFAIFFNQTSVLKLIVNTNNVSELIRWRKIRWRLFFIWSNTYSCISRVFCLSSSTHYISIGTKFEKFDFTKFFIYLLSHWSSRPRWKLFLFDQIHT